MIFAHVNIFCSSFSHYITTSKLRRSYDARMMIEEDVRKELEAVKVSTVFISPNLWYYQVLLFVA
jgi:hypothetical protein